LNNLKLKIVLISTGQPSLNPRLVKEADALAASGYDVTVLYSYWNDWGAKFDKTLLPTKKWKAICIGGDPDRKPLLYFLSKLIHKVAREISKRTNGRRLTDLAIARTVYFLARAAKKHKADIYIGHNLGALPALIKAAKANQKPCGFDAEDFHRNEISNKENDTDVLIKTRLEEKYFPNLNYVSASSPLIASAYAKLFPELTREVVLNVFPTDKRISEPIKNNEGPVKLFWFSQTIGHSRGLEGIMKALEAFEPGTYELHLLGHSDASFKAPQNKNVYFHAPIPSDELINFASKFDIGLAAETGIPLNRDICLTNKIFTYIQAGLCVVASDTSAQTKLLSKYPGIGKIFLKNRPKSLADTLFYYHQHRDKLFEARTAAFETGQSELNWETESKNFLKLVKKTLMPV
jgi:glycosyltransferase involved in cell wall biosynthesis